MILGVISDTHDRLGPLDEALRFFADRRVDRVVHCGDWKSLAALAHFARTAADLGLGVTGVLGNNDADPAAFLVLARTLPGDVALYEGVHEFVADNRTVAVYHGHHAPTLRRVREDPRYDLVLLGHTHKPLIEHEADRLIVNPGSVAFAIPRSKSWQPIVALVDTLALDAELVTLGS